MSKKDIAAKNNPSGQELTLDLILKEAAPLVKEWRKADIEKIHIESETDKYFFEKDQDYKRYVTKVVLTVFFSVMALVTFLFISNKDKIATDLLIIAITNSIAFFGGYGIAKSKYENE